MMEFAPLEQAVQQARDSGSYTIRYKKRVPKTSRRVTKSLSIFFGQRNVAILFAATVIFSAVVLALVQLFQTGLP